MKVIFKFHDWLAIFLMTTIVMRFWILHRKGAIHLINIIVIIIITIIIIIIIIIVIIIIYATIRKKV